MTDANAQGTAAHTQPTSDDSARTVPNRPAATTRRYEVPDADCVRGSEYSEILALETEQRKRAAEHRRKRGHKHPDHAHPEQERSHGERHGHGEHHEHGKSHGKHHGHRLDDDSGLAHIRRDLAESIATRADSLTAILKAIHAHPETAYEEYFASRTLVDAVREAHPNLSVEYPAFGLDTAFKVELTSADYDPAKHRTIAILSEYDALPGIGHGCGHNVIAVSGLGAFLALADALAAGPEAFSGRVLYYGTPAEESDAGKELMARAGAFEQVDAAIMVHPYFMDVADQAWLGRRECRVTYTGVSAHASSHPFMGRNALDAANLAYQGLGLLRQQIPGSDRIHAIIDHGGDAPNLIPASASLHINIRSKHAPTLRALSRRVEEVLRGAALMAGVSAEVTWDSSPMTMPVRTNRPLLKRWVSAQRSVGRHPYPPGTVSDTLAASTDFGNVSLRVPGIHPLIQIAPEGTGMHTVEFAHYADTPAAADAALDAAFGLASVALDFLVDDELAQAVRADFEASGGAVDVEGYFSDM
ncbi:amidohydrolase [uncultured Rothia sp.]|uniref:amidohydrolase n=1 Tax=uncultured Rothia sp. TaxID=316088 RepID=UPI0025F9CAC6|nr:amidohydrolase [uncultured Rothia sp.]